MKTIAYQQCINPTCSATFDIGQVLTSCAKCGELLDIQYDWSKAPLPKSLDAFQQRWQSRRFPLDYSGVWRFRELLPFAADAMVCTVGEGQTFLQNAVCLGKELGMWPGQLWLQYEGMNPSGSFKDNGMTAAFTHARIVGARRVACASTGNTSASLALYAAMNGFQGVVFIGSGKIAFGKLSQALDYGALTLQIEGDFDTCLARVRQVSSQLGLYLMNSVNPFRLEGQKTIMYRILESLSWQPPDWIIVPGGNLGNCSAFGKAFHELRQLGLIKRIPRLAIINAEGANTLYSMVHAGISWNGGHVNQAAIDGFYADMDRRQLHAHTVASAIEIGRPVNLKKALRSLDVMKGVVAQVSDNDILEAKAMVGRFGFACEPASAATIAGLRQLLANGTISRHERVACVLTGHGLKDPDATVYYHTGVRTKEAKYPPAEPTWGHLANKPIRVADDLQAIIRSLGLDEKSIDQDVAGGYVETSRELPFIEY
ncbi:MAG: threonine synthase [Phycisphaerales bacterium]|nr:threonine synthase [Phycisphaerales bacterium]